MPLTSLNRDVCERAYKARDARFDGRFFIGVKTTGIFCRPICPAPSPQSRNVDFFPSAAAAAASGLRPCLRCKPEASPGTPDWEGSAATVSRALRLIHEGILDEHSVETLASRFNITTRQLSRLFQKHLGASPVKVAQTRRLLFAKKLLDESSLSITDIAFTAGFSSVRRFNDVFLNTYGRAPSSLRKTNTPINLSLKLPYRPPYDWDNMLNFLALREVAGVEKVIDGRYYRCLNINGKPTLISLHHAEDEHALLLSLISGDSRHIMKISERARRVFDLAADPDKINEHLRQDDRLSALVHHNPGLRLPGAWSHFEVLIRGILGQQVSVQAATTLAGRIVERCSTPSMAFPNGEAAHCFPTPRDILDHSLDGLGITGRRIDTIKCVAEACVTNQLPLEELMTVEQLRDALLPLPGIGPWTVEYLAMRGLSEPDAFPAFDLGLLKATGLDSKALGKLAEDWRPWRAYAAIHLWNSL